MTIPLFACSPHTTPLASEKKLAVTSWYQSGSRTANGEKFNPNAMTAAHKSYPFGTVLRLHYHETSKVVDVRINDRGPFIKGRHLDVSRGVAQKLGFINRGEAKLYYEKLN